MEPTTRASRPITAVVLTISAIVVGCVTAPSRSSPPAKAEPPAPTEAASSADLNEPAIEAEPNHDLGLPDERLPGEDETDPRSEPTGVRLPNGAPISSPRLSIRGDAVREASSGDTVTLEAVLDGGAIAGANVAWRQVAGPSVELHASDDAHTVDFIAPEDLTEDAQLVFEATIDGEADADAQTVTVMVAATALRPDAGPDKRIVLGDAVYLDGGVSGGVPGYVYRWSPTTGLAGATTARPLAAPRQTTTYTLTVTDSTGAAASDTVTVMMVPGRVYFVAAGRAGASDSNIGSETYPWLTIGKAASVAGPGDTVLVRTGTYVETLKPLNSGTSTGKLTFKVRGGDAVALDGTGVLRTGVDLSLPASYVRVEGFEIRNFTGTGVFFQPWGSQGVTGAEIVGNRIHDNRGDGISARESVRSLVENNEIYANGLTAVAIGGKYGSTDLVIRGNDIHFNGKDGVQGGGKGVTVEHNRIYDQFHTTQHQDGLDVSDVQNLTVRYNTIFDVTQPVYVHNQEGPCSGIRVYGNAFYNDRYFTVAGGQSPGVFIDARFAGDGVTAVQIHSNTFGWTGYSGVRIFGSVSGVTLRNNVLYESGIGLGATSVTNVTSDYNVFYKSVIPRAEGPHSRIADPQFVNYSRNASWDFHLLLTSPAINAGDPALGTAVVLPPDFHDIDVRPRPGGLTYDTGAFER